MGGKEMTGEILDRLARIETKLDDMREDKKDHEERLRKLETRGSWLSGFYAAAGALLGAGAGHLPKF